MFRAIIFLQLILFCNNVLSFNILLIISLPLKSHFMAMQPLFKELALKGHNVTIVNNFPETASVRNLKYIDLKVEPSEANFFPPLTAYEDKEPNYLRWFNFYRHLSAPTGFIKSDCECILKNQELKEDLSKVNYDVIFVEQFMSDCGLVFGGVALDAPIIGITSHVILPFSYSRLGIAFDFSTDGFYFSDAGFSPSLFQKMESFLMHHMMMLSRKWFSQHEIYNVFKNYYPKKDIDIEKIAEERMVMTFAFQHFSYSGARLLPPHLIEIGGLHIKKPESLPQEINDFLNKAVHGAVYVNFGTNLKPSTMSVEKFEHFVEAFRRISPMRVLFKWNNGSIPDVNNTLAQRWFPQMDVLCHPKVKVFISHGGMLSTSEAASCGVPMVVIPFFGDQFGNAGFIKSSGLGTILHFYDVTGQTLTDAIKRVLDDSYQERAKVISRNMNVRPISAMDNAVYWTEFVAKYKQSPLTFLPRNDSWFHKVPLDIALLLLVMIVSLFYIVYKLGKLFFSLTINPCLNSRKPEIKKKTN